MNPSVQEYFKLLGVETLVRNQMELTFQQEDREGVPGTPKVKAAVRKALLTEGVEALTKQAAVLIDEAFQPPRLLDEYVAFLKTPTGQHALFVGHMLQARLHELGDRIGQEISSRICAEMIPAKKPKKKPKK